MPTCEYRHDIYIALHRYGHVYLPGYAGGILPGESTRRRLLAASVIIDAYGNPLTGSAAFGFLVVNAGQSLNLSGSGQIYTVQQLIMGTGSTLDVGNDAVRVQYAAGADPGAAIQALLAEGYNMGHWNGVGIVSSAAASDGRGISGVGYFDDGQMVTIGTVLYGDANLDGLINADDLSLMFAGQLTGQTRWQDGEF